MPLQLVGPSKQLSDAQYAELLRGEREALPSTQQAGELALERLMEIANRDSGQPRKIARLLLGLYNGERFPFDLSEFRCLDIDLFIDCLTVIKMDYWSKQGIHDYFEDGRSVFEALAAKWKLLGVTQGD